MYSKAEKYNHPEHNWVNEWVEYPNDYTVNRILLVGDSVTRHIHRTMRKYLFSNSEYLVDLLATSVLIEENLLEHFKVITQMERRKYFAVFIFVTHHMGGYTLDEYREFVEGLITVFEEFDLPIILVGASSVKGNEGWTKLLFLRNELFRDLAQQRNIKYIDTEEIVSGTEHYLDNIHYDHYMNVKVACMLARQCCEETDYPIVDRVYEDNEKGNIREEDLAKKNENIIRVFAKWFMLKQKGINITEYLLGRKYCNFAIYGMGHLGKALLNELQESEIEIKYIVDRNRNVKAGNIEVFSPGAELPDNVDVLIVTAIDSLDEITAHIENKVNVAIVSLKQIVNDMESAGCL